MKVHRIDLGLTQFKRSKFDIRVKYHSLVDNMAALRMVTTDELGGSSISRMKMLIAGHDWRIQTRSRPVRRSNERASCSMVITNDLRDFRLCMVIVCVVQDSVHEDVWVGTYYGVWPQTWVGYLFDCGHRPREGRDCLSKCV